MACPAIDRTNGVALSLGNLSWQNEPIQKDVEALANCPVEVENDAKLAALSEAMLLKQGFSKALYVTVSTGIGYALVADGVIDTSVGDGGGRALLLEHNGKLTPWEDFASGRAIVERYGQKAVDIDDSSTWESISRDLAQGLIQLISIAEPDVIVIGGGVGSSFDKLAKPLQTALQKYKLPLVKLPTLQGAQRPEEAVIYGCYELAKQHYGN